MKPSNLINYLSVLEHLLPVMVWIVIWLSCWDGADGEGGLDWVSNGSLWESYHSECLYVHSNLLQMTDRFIPIWPCRYEMLLGILETKREYGFIGCQRRDKHFKHNLPCLWYERHAEKNMKTWSNSWESCMHETIKHSCISWHFAQRVIQILCMINKISYLLIQKNKRDLLVVSFRDVVVCHPC